MRDIWLILVVVRVYAERGDGYMLGVYADIGVRGIFLMGVRDIWVIGVRDIWLIGVSGIC